MRKMSGEMSDVVNNENNINSSINKIAKNHNTISNASPKDKIFKCTLNDEDRRNEKDIKTKIKQIKCCLDVDIRSCDFTWSLFQSALNSYRFDSCLRPYPSIFLKNGYKDPARMRAVSNHLPNMKTLRDTINELSYSQDTIDLLYWVLVQHRDPYLLLHVHDNAKPKVSVLFQHISEMQLTIVPNYIYEVVYSQQHEVQWQQRKSNKNGSIYAFHGSRLDNFYSIIKFGLQQHLSCSETLFGDGIYLSSELLLSLTYSPAGIAWDKSIYGSNFSIVALCEIINDTEKVKCQDVSHKKRCVNAGSIGGTVPDKYYVVLNSELVRVRYLLVYKHTADSESAKEPAHTSLLICWLKKHKILILLILYILLLFFIGFVNSSSWYKYQRAFKSYFDSDD